MSNHATEQFNSTSPRAAADTAATGEVGAAAHALTGEWEGFTFREAYAWCIVLDEFESGNVLGHWRSPEPQQQRAALRAGLLPVGGSFARVARAHRDRGLTPESYRHHREALGFTPLRLR